MFKIVKESKTQTEPDDYLEFTFKTSLYFANQFRRSLLLYPEIYTFSNIKIIENTTNIENANLITRLELLPIKHSLIKNNKNKYTIDYLFDKDYTMTELKTNIIKPEICPLECMFGMICKGEKISVEMEIEKGIGKQHAKYHASSIPIFKNTEDTKKNSIHEISNFSYKIISVGAITPREQCIATFEGILIRINNFEKEFNNCINNKDSNIYYLEKSDHKYKFIIEKHDDVILYLLRSKIFELYPQIGNVGYNIIHEFDSKYEFNIYEKSKDPIKIIMESINDLKLMINQYLIEFKKL